MYDAMDIERVRELLLKGWSKAAIARHLRISRRVIYNWAALGYFVAPPREPRVRAGTGSKLLDRTQAPSNEVLHGDERTQRVR